MSAEKVNEASSEVSTVRESEKDVDTADSNPENVEVAEYDSCTDVEEEVEGGGFTHSGT